MTTMTINKVKVSIPAWLAKEHQAARIMEGEVVRETKNAILFRGTAHFNGTHCSVCGTTLTNPLSVALGIGPICGKRYIGTKAPRLEDLTPEEVAAYRAKVMERVVEFWVPKKVAEIEVVGQEIVEVPDTPKEEPVTPQRQMKQGREARLVNGKIQIVFPFDREVLNRVREIPGRRFQATASPKHWTAPVSQEALDILTEAGFEIDPEIKRILAPKEAINELAPAEIPGLFPFQQKGVGFLESRNGRALIADEMGLGKTVQALAWLRLHPQKRPAIVVAPAAVKLNWAKEAVKWIEDPRVQVLEGKKPYPVTGEILVLNYDILPAWLEALKEINPQVIIMDEIHYTKNNQAQRTKAAKQLTKGVPHVIGLSGTPIVNRPVEAFNALKMIDPTVVPSWWDYVHRYCDAKYNGFGWDFTGASNTEELHRKLTSTIMLRRLKADVLSDLPDKIRGAVPLELDNAKEYRKAEADFIAWLAEKDTEAAQRASRAQQLAEIEHLKQLAAQGKLKQAISWIRDFIEGDGKLVVFATHKFVIDALMDAFGEQAVKIDGSVSGQARQDAVDRFQTDDSVRLFVGNIKAAGAGITLTAASSVAFLELPWTPGDLSQAEDRCHRIGQKDSVNIYYLLAEGTIDERIARILDQKREVLNSVLDGKEMDEDSTLTALLEEMTG